MKLVLKGEFNDLGNFPVVKEIYTVLQPLLNELGKIKYTEGKREVSFTSTLSNTRGKTIKVIENKNTEVLTIILK